MHQREDGTAQSHEQQAHAQAEQAVDQQGDGICLVDPAGVLRADVLGDENGRGGTHHREHNQQQVRNLVGVADGPHTVGVIPAHHNLIGVAHQHL